MTTTLKDHKHAASTRASLRLAGPAFILGGITFLVGGVTHPSGDTAGNKVVQLHEMLINSSWYPSHALQLVAMALFAIGILAFQRRRDLSPGMAQVLKYAFVIACVAVVATTLHLFAALDADSLADGKHSLTSRLQAVNETVFAIWGLTMATLAVVGGLTRTIGNRITIPFGLIGGAAFALAAGTIAYTDTFDSLFKMGSLLAVWAVLVGVIAIRQPADVS